LLGRIEIGKIGAEWNEDCVGNSLEARIWLFRGVPAESPEVEDVLANGEVYPPRPGNIGEFARYCHSINEMTDTGYTSWTTEREIAEELARYSSNEADLGGDIIIFRVRISTIGQERIFEGLGAECDYLIENTVENVEVSGDGENNEDNE
jgi:hypothetical protein